MLSHCRVCIRVKIPEARAIAGVSVDYGLAACVTDQRAPVAITVTSASFFLPSESSRIHIFFFRSSLTLRSLSACNLSEYRQGVNGFEAKESGFILPVLRTLARRML
jgi:hypothetical protein